MDQLSLYDFLTEESEMIHCPLTPSFHWLRITNGHTPDQYSDRIHFTMNGYDYLYETSEGLTEVVGAYKGEIHTISWEQVSDKKNRKLPA